MRKLLIFFHFAQMLQNVCFGDTHFVFYMHAIEQPMDETFVIGKHGFIVSFHLKHINILCGCRLNLHFHRKYRDTYDIWCPVCFIIFPILLPFAFHALLFHISKAMFHISKQFQCSIVRNSFHFKVFCQYGNGIHTLFLFLIIFFSKLQLLF